MLLPSYLHTYHTHMLTLTHVPTYMIHVTQVWVPLLSWPGGRCQALFNEAASAGMARHPVDPATKPG